MFKRNGFNIYGGKWRQPIDFMHFQAPKSVAESLIMVPRDKAQVLWDKHLRECGN